jgi:hypothetical protein
VPVERLIQLALIACAMLMGLFILPTDMFKMSGILFLVFGIVVTVAHVFFGGVDFAISNLVPFASRWWGDATEDTKKSWAKSWYFYVGMVSLGAGCVYLVVGLTVSFIKSVR